MSNNIRLRFSGLVIFAARLFSILTGLIFVYITTHHLTLGEFGAWQNISNLVSIATLGSTVIPFWSARYAARSFQGAMKLGFLANIGLGTVVALIGATIGSIILAPAAQTQPVYYLYAGILIFQTYAIGALDPVVSLQKTHILSYAYASYEAIRVVSLYVLMVIFKLGIPAAITALLIANIGWFAVYAIVVREHWSETLSFGYLRQWFRGSLINYFMVTASILTSLELQIIILIAGPLASAQYGAAAAIILPISFTSALSTALYPRLLGGAAGEDVDAALKMTLLFSIPLTFAVIGLSSSLDFILGPEYVAGYLVLSVLALRSFIGSFSATFDAIVQGTERMDEKGLIHFREALRSRLILPQAITIIISAVYLPMLWVLLPRYASDPVTAALATAALGTPAALAIIISKFLIARRYMRFHFPLGSTLKFAFIGGTLALAVPALYLLGLITLPLRPIVTVGLFLLGAGIYFFVLYFIEDEAKSLIDGVFAWVRSAL